MIALNILMSSYSEKVPLYVPSPTEDKLMLGSEINRFFVVSNIFLSKNEWVPYLSENPYKLDDSCFSLIRDLDN